MEARPTVVCIHNFLRANLNHVMSRNLSAMSFYIGSMATKFFHHHLINLTCSVLRHLSCVYMILTDACLIHFVFLQTALVFYCHVRGLFALACENSQIVVTHSTRTLKMLRIFHLVKTIN